MQEIRNVVLERSARLAAGDVAGAQAFCLPQIVSFTLAPPLTQPGDTRDPGPITAWLSTFEAPPRREIIELEITAGAEVAFATYLESMTATPRGGGSEFTLWYRVTLGLSRAEGRWLIAHEHNSVPFHMDGSLRAAVDLKP
jgi:ketosteroid isomerase-like protein